MQNHLMKSLITILVLIVLVQGQSQITTEVPKCTTDGDVPSWNSTQMRFNCSTPSGGSPIPSGSILLINTGSCPSGFTEVSALSGKTLLGTVNANADVGGTGGADNVTPAGTIQQATFTGNSSTVVINHTHDVTITDPGHFHAQAVNSATTGGLSGYTPDTSSNTSATSGYNTGSKVTGITAASANPSGGAANYTPAGTINSQTFTGSSLDNRSAFVKVIFCKKD